MFGISRSLWPQGREGWLASTHKASVLVKYKDQFTLYCLHEQQGCCLNKAIVLRHILLTQMATTTTTVTARPI